MSQKKGSESEDERKEREHQDSIHAEPDWTDIETSKAWLEERYPLLDDAAFGSPLFRYMKDPTVWRGRAPAFLASMLSFHEMMRFSGETTHFVEFDQKQEKLYPEYGYGYPRHEHAPEPDWTDIKASKAWLEQRYPLGHSELSSPLLRYMNASYASGDSRCSPMKYLGSMLTEDEWKRFSRYRPASDGQRHHSDPDYVLYPEYEERMWLAEAPVPKAKEARPQSSSQRPRITSLPSPVAKPAMFPESYLPQLSTQTQSGSRFNKREGGDGDDGPPEHLASKRPHKTSDLGEGVVMPAKPLNPYEDIDGPREQNGINSGLMPPPPQPQQKAASVIRIGLQQNNKLGSSSSRQDTIGVTKTPPRPTPHVEDNIDAKDNPNAMDLESDVFGHRASAPSSTKMPLADSSRKRGIEDVSDEQSASSAPKRRRTSDTVGNSSPISGPPMKRKRSIEEAEDAPPTTSSPKRQRTPPYSSGNELSPSSPFDPPERSTPTPSPRLDNTPTENRTRGELPDPAPLHQEYEDTTTVVFRPSEVEEESALQSGSQSEVMDRRRSPEARNPGDQPISRMRDHEAAPNGGSKTQKSGKAGPVLSEPNLQDMPIEEDPDDMIIAPERTRDQRTIHFIQNRGDRTEQTAISVVIPLQTLRRQRAAIEDLSPDEDTIHVPVIQQNRKRGRKAGTKGRKAPKSKSQLDQKKRKPPTKGRKNRQSKPERESQAYVGRLRSGVGGRKHKKPSKYFTPP